MKITSFNNSWKFSLNEGEWKEVTLPHDFSICQERSKENSSGKDGGFFKGGVGSYEKTFVSKRNKKYFLMIEGSFGITEVFVNYNLAYVNKYPYNSFLVDMTDYLRYDKENLIQIKVNNSNLPNARWYTGAGLYRDVYLCECSDTYLLPNSTFIKTDAVLEDTAYLSCEIELFSHKKGTGVLEIQLFQAGKKAPCYTEKTYIFASQGENKITTRLQIENPLLWDVDAPNMYTAKATLTLNGCTDTDTADFGIRTVFADSKKGLLLNGKPIKLRGGCVHHDHGPLGACSYADAEYRRIALLKKAGFNSVRCSHNPQSPHFYDACDKLGMLVIDELFDYWTEGKKTNDFHIFFEENYEKWTRQIVKKNRSHPSIIMWSTGNEISQKTGRGNGFEIAKTIADTTRELDSTRLITHALCILWNVKEEFEKENATKDLGADQMDYFAIATSTVSSTCDVIGYNYLEYRIDRDLVRFPNRLIANTETFPLSAFSTIKQQLSNPRILGDFVWTAWDYFGETGIGHVDYYEKVEQLYLFDYPYHIAGCGDIDICGRRKPQSYYREIAWGLREKPYLAVRHPKNAHVPQFPSAWGFYECEPSWKFDGYEGTKTQIFVLADCDYVTLEINGKEIGKGSQAEEGIYVFETEYIPGTVSAKAYKNGKCLPIATLSTEGEVHSIQIEREDRYLAKATKKPDEEIVFVNVSLRDENGKICTQGQVFVEYQAQGADIIGLANGRLDTTESYQRTEGSTYKGSALIVLKKYKDASAPVLIAKSPLGTVTLPL